MKIDFAKLNGILEAKANRAIDRLDGLKCYTPEFQETLDAILFMLDASKKLDTYDTECQDCKHNKKELENQSQDQQTEDLKNQLNKLKKEYIGKPYTPFGNEKQSDNRIVMFYSKECQPCVYLKPILETFAVEQKLELELVSVNDEAGQNHAKEHGVQGWPTVFAVINNVIQHAMFGADPDEPIETTKEQLKKELLPFFS
jgi:thiol-disulfide isomerase/thioredoxin